MKKTARRAAAAIVGLGLGVGMALSMAAPASANWGYGGYGGYGYKHCYYPNYYPSNVFSNNDVISQFGVGNTAIQLF